MGPCCRQQHLWTAIWSVLQAIRVNTSGARNRRNSLFSGEQTGLGIGVLSVVLATVAMHLCYFLSVGVTIFMDNFEPAKAPSEDFL